MVEEKQKVDEEKKTLTKQKEGIKSKKYKRLVIVFGAVS